MIAFLDLSTLIYLIEGKQPFAGKAQKALQGLLKRNPALRTAVSRMAWLECRVQPIKAGDASTLAVYDAFFARPDLLTVELDAQVVELATQIRARHGLKTPDALHAACCLQLGPDHAFVTGDAGFRRVAGLNVRLVG